MSCTGHGDCKQGRAPCRTPLTCSGMPVDEAIEHMRKHVIPPRRPHVPPQVDGPARRPRAAREAVRFIWRPRLYLAVGAVALVAGFAASRFL